MRLLSLLRCCLALVSIALFSAASRAQSRVDDRGQLERLPLGPGWLSPKTDIRFPTKGWGKSVYLSSTRNPKIETTPDGKTWIAELSHANGPAVHVEQHVRYDGNKVVFDLKATGLRDGDSEGVIFYVNIPADGFAGGNLKAADQLAPLPKTLNDKSNHVWGGSTASLRFNDAKSQSAVCVAFEPAAKVTVQDSRRWGSEFSAMISLHSGNLPAGQSASLKVTIWADGQIDQSPAHVRIDPAKPRYQIIGNGGNYCFGIESPVTRYTLDNLKVSISRTEMSIRSWAAKEAPGDPAINDWKLFAAADQPNSRVRHEMALMQELTRKRIPFILSIWRMPAYMTLPVDPKRGGSEKRRIGDEQWPRVLQAVGAYLLYARERYQAEPDYFSFNEPDIGIDILFTAEEHRDAIKRLGSHFAKLGLKTKLIAGDTGNARGTHKYVLPTIQDPDALKHVGAIAFHSWNGATPAQYAAWADVAESVKLPLFCNEAGVDPFAWQGGKYRSFAYAMREMVHYQELLLHARPQGIVYWEFTGDYSLMQSDRSTGRDPVVTERLCLQKHWCDLTPPGSTALSAATDNDHILATAFRTPANGYAIHLANPKWSRPVTLEGLPPTVTTLKVTRTAKDELFKTLETLPVKDGKATLTLPTESLTTLTTP